jgi:DHA1 family bicyclomycin/chloramphenicol resistance-like MFS transporter
MEKGLQVNAAQLQQVITAYMVPFAFASLVHGPLSDAVGRRPVMIWGMALYTVGSVACTLAPNYESLIARACCRARPPASAWSSAAR